MGRYRRYRGRDGVTDGMQCRTGVILVPCSRAKCIKHDWLEAFGDSDD